MQVAKYILLLLNHSYEKQKDLLKEMLNKSPVMANREVVKPVKLHTNQQVDKPTSPQVVKPTNHHVDEPTNTQDNKPTKPQVDKYTTHLKRETIKRIKIFAAENDIADYEVVQSALDRYFERHK